MWMQIKKKASSWTSMWSENFRPHAPPWGNSNSLWLPKLCGLCDCDQDKFTAWFLGQKGGKPRGRLACFCEQILVVGVRPSYWWGLALSVLEVEPTKLTVGKSTKFLSFYVIFKSNTLKLWKRQKKGYNIFMKNSDTTGLEKLWIKTN